MIKKSILLSFAILFLNACVTINNYDKYRYIGTKGAHGQVIKIESDSTLILSNFISMNNYNGRFKYKRIGNFISIERIGVDINYKDSEVIIFPGIDDVYEDSIIELPFDDSILRKSIFGNIKIDSKKFKKIQKNSKKFKKIQKNSKKFKKIQKNSKKYEFLFPSLV